MVGNGMVGHHCVEQLLAGGALAHYRIEVFGEEAQRAYDRVHLSEYFGGRDAESLAMGAASLYEAEGLILHPYTMRNENSFLPANFRKGTDANAYGDSFGAFKVYFDTGIDGIFTDNPDTGLLAHADFVGD